jgi:hypothetical protein
MTLVEKLDRLAEECERRGINMVAARLDRIASLLVEGLGVTGPEPGGPPTSMDWPALGQPTLPPLPLKIKQPKIKNEIPQVAEPGNSPERR